MSKIELYLVKSSTGQYDDYRESNDLIIYATLEAAEKRKQEIIDAHQVTPFPLDWCTEEQFDELRWHDDEVKRSKITDEHIEIVEQWEMENHYTQDFGSAWVQPVELDLQSWRERQLGNLL
jgi:hypothetical protein